jgi:hypothetical protein
MNAQLEETLVRTERLRQELRWEPWKAFAAILIGVAAMAGVILTVAHFLPTPAPQPIVIQLQTPK